MTKLNAVNVGMNKFCGPAVLSILTGKSTDECAFVISSINGQYRVEGVQLNDLLRAADKLGFDQQSMSVGGSLYSTLVMHSNNDGMYIVTVPNHFVCIEVNDKKIYFCDNHTKEPMPAASSARLLQRVLAVHKVTKRREPVLIGTSIEVGVTKYSYCIQITTKRMSLYDMPNYDKSETVSIITLKNEQEYEDWIAAVKGLNE